MFPTDLLRLLREGLSKLDLGIMTITSLIIIITLYCVVCPHLCLTMSAVDLSGWKVLLNYVVEAVTLRWKKRSFECKIFILSEHRTERALWSFHREITSFHDWDACYRKQGVLEVLYTLWYSQNYFWCLKKKKWNKNEKATACPNHQKSPQKTQQNQTNKNPWSLLCGSSIFWVFFANSPELQLLRCVRIAVLSLSRHLQNQGFEVWLWVCFCLRSGLRFQCLFSFPIPFLSCPPQPELKAQPAW